MKRQITLFTVLVFLFSISGIAKSYTTATVKNHFNDVINITIDKSTTDKEIGDIMASLNKQGVKAAFTNIRRNEDNEIIAINIDITKNGSTSSYSASSNTAINKIIINIDGNFVSVHNEGLQVFGFGNQDELTKSMKEQMAAFKNQFANKDELKKMIEQQKSMFNGAHFNADDTDDIFSNFFSNNSNNLGLQNPNEYNYKKQTKSTYIVNGKEMSKEQYEKTDKSKIKSLQIKEEVIKSYNKNF